MAILNPPRLALGLAFLATLGAPALAHVTAEPASAPAGAYAAVRFRVGHGCQGAATTALRLEMPPGLASVRPQPKPGWTLEIQRDPDGGRVAAVTWRGALPADQFDEFALLLRLPEAPQALHFAALQSCGERELRWIERPDPAAPAARLSHPAPRLQVTGPADAPSHRHH